MERAAPWLGLAAVILAALAIASRWERGEEARPGTSRNAPAQVRPSLKPAVASPRNAGMPQSPQQADPPAVVDLFPHQDWTPPPPPPPIANAPVAPAQLPPLPFSVGALWLDDSGAFYAVLNAQGREFPLCAACRQSGFYREGDVLLGTYRIEKLTSREVRFLYLPMKRRQQMSLAG